MLILLACTSPAPDTGAPPSRGAFAFTSTAHVALPYATAGQAAPAATLELTAVGTLGSPGDLSVVVDGPFTVEGSAGALSAAETRVLTVRYDGDMATPALGVGSVTFSTGGDSVTTTVAYVVGDPALPDVSWTDTGWGQLATVPLPHAPYPYGDAPYDDASVLLFVPDGTSDGEPVTFVTHLHGWNATLSEVATAQRLAEQVALSGRDAVLVVPQGPVEAESGDFGRLMEPGGLDALLDDVLMVLYRSELSRYPARGALALSAHSGGYLATAAILDDVGADVDAVMLFDALYGETDTFAAFALEGGVLRSVYTDSGGTRDQNLALAETLSAAGLDVSTRFTDDALAASDLTFGPTDASHSGCVRDERAFARWLAASGLPHRPAWPPELVATVSDGYDTMVSWRGDRGGEGLRYRVEGSDDGERWRLLTDTASTSATVQATAYIRVATVDVRYGTSEPSDTYGGTGADWLVVDGFDRALDGSYDLPTHPFAAQIANTLGARFSIASNEAIATGEVDLALFPRVLWLLGDEGTSDRTFSPDEQDAIASFVANGGTFVVSGSELGYATDAAWLSDVLGASFVEDDAGTTSVEGWTVGAAYTEDSPDVLDGAEVLWRWDTGGAAAVGAERRLVAVGFGLENLSELDREEALASLLSWLGG